MRTRILISIIFSIIIYGSGLAQEEQNKTVKSCLFKPSSFEMQIGGTMSHYTSTMNDFNNMQKLVPFGIFLNNYLDSFEFDGTPASSSFSFKIDIGLSPFSKKNNVYRENRELKISLGSNMGRTNQYSFVKETSIRYDTLQSTHGDIIEYLDSINRKSYTFSQYIHEINLGASFIFKTNMARKISFFAGGGFEYGFSVISQVIEEYSNYTRADNSYGSNSYLGGNDIYEKNVINVNKNSHFLRVCIPVGINYRLSNKSNFFKHVNFDVQLSPGLAYTFVNKESSLRPYTYIAVGYKYTW